MNKLINSFSRNEKQGMITGFSSSDCNVKVLFSAGINASRLDREITNKVLNNKNTQSL